MAAASPSIAIVAKLKATAAVTNVVGQRIYPQKGTQEPEFPMIVLTTIGGTGNRPLKNANRALKRYTVRIDCYAETELGAQTLGKLVRDAITPDSTPWQDDTNGVQGCFHADSVMDETEDGIRFQSETFDVWHTPT